MLSLPSPSTVTGKLSFKRAFWIIAISIAVMQIYSIIMELAYRGSIFAGTGDLPFKYYVSSEIFGLIWYLSMTAVIIWDIKRVNIPPAHLFKIKFTLLKQFGTKVLKYFAGCALAILLLELLMPGPSELVAHDSPLLMALSFISAVIMAPICEEIACRGYLYTAMIPTFRRKNERIVVNAMLFAAAHVFLVTFFIGASIPYYIFIIGLLLAKLYEDSRSILPGILLHALNNGFVFAIDLLKNHDMFISLY